MNAPAPPPVKHPIPAGGVWALWLGLRVPVLLGLAVVFRVQLLALLERLVGIGAATKIVIFELSTATSRLLVFGLSTVVLVLVVEATQRARAARTRLLISGAFASVIFLGSLALTWRHPLGALAGLVLAVVFTLNASCADWLSEVVSRPGRGRWFQRLLLVVPGILEFLFPRLWWQWLLQRSQRVRATRSVPFVSLIAGSAICSLMLAVALPWKPLLKLDREIYGLFGSQVEVLGRADMNWLELDKDKRHLFVSGHGLERLLRYDLDHLDKAPEESQVSIGWAQAFSYDPSRERLFVFNPFEQRLMSLDAKSLAPVEEMKLPDVSPGDSWILYDPRTDQVTVASEADFDDGIPTAFIAWSEKKVLGTLTEPFGNLLAHPKKPYIYRSYFRAADELEIYDTDRGEVIARVALDPRSDRIAYWDKGNEILVASPVRSRVTRYDADTLAPKGAYKTTFGVRTVAVDQRRNLLLCGSLATSKLEVLDLETGRRVSRFHVGPWMRSIVLLEERGLAYISTVEGLLKLRYVEASSGG